MANFANWDYVEIESVASLVTNGFVGTVLPHQTEEEDSVLYVQGYNVRENRLDIENITRVTHEFSASQPKSILQTGDMLTVQSGHIGATAVVPPELAGANCHSVIITRFFRDVVEPHFVAYYLNSEIGRKHLKGLIVGSSVLHINTKDLKKFLIPLPPLPEQRRIAEILGTWDEAIALTERLIEALTHRKRGLMQLLLTGAVRFERVAQSVYSYSDWQWDRLGSIVKSYKNGFGRRPSGNEDGPIVLRLSDVTKGFIDLSSPRRVQMSEEEFKTYKLNKNDLLFIRVNGSRDYLAQCIFVGQDYEDVAFNDHLIRVQLTETDVDAQYVQLYCNDPLTRSRLLSSVPLAQGGQLTINQQALSELEIVIPPLDEQRQIADFATICNHEIDVLHKYHAALTTQKRGLMQQLLTGQIRVGV